MSSPVLETGSTAIAFEDRSISGVASLAQSTLFRLILLTIAVLLVHGYHPFADDAGGIYVAGIEKMMHPHLFGSDAGFILAHTKLSIFSHVFASALELLHLPLELGLFFSYLLTTFAFLLGSLRVSQRIFRDETLAWGATLLAGALFTIPVAATSLYLMDPDPTARSFSTPLSLFTLAACMDRRWKQMALWFVLTASLHPLMAAHLACFLIMYVAVTTHRWRLPLALCATGFAACAIIYIATRHAPLPDGYLESMLMPEHSYFFLSRWHWYELLGIIMPPLLMLLTAFRVRTGSAVFNVCITCIALGVTATLSAACFVHTDGSFFLARIQPLRSFQLIYAVGVLLLGGFLASYLSGPRAVWGALFLVLLSGLMLFVQKQIYTTSAHIEWPFAAPKNPWQQAFIWARLHTPPDAFFAADPDYAQSASEDAQGFRTTAERGILTDGLKDEGAVTMFPALAPKWKKDNNLELNLDHISDQERIRRLKPEGVTWLLLSAQAKTNFPCPYRNSAAAICQLP